MVSGNKKKRKNNSNKKNKLQRNNQTDDNVEEAEEQNESVDDELDEVASKGPHSEDSDAEDEPKKKKKKKQQVPTETGKGKKSIRQMKREKHAQRQSEEAAAAKDQLKSQCVSYLSQWKHDKANWKFMKAKQVWLYKNKFSSYLVPDSSWHLLLEYFESAKGNIRNLLLADAKKVIMQMDEWTESVNNTDNSKKDEDKDDTEEKAETHAKPDDTAYKRARDLIQCLEE